jgi:hypothetical protein
LIRLARLLFAVARRPVPYHDRLCAELDTLSGWDSGYLRNVFTRIACDGDTDLQLDLEQRVELLLEENGIFVHRRWADRVRRFRDGDR